MTCTHENAVTWIKPWAFGKWETHMDCPDCGEYKYRFGREHKDMIRYGYLNADGSINPEHDPDVLFAAERRASMIALAIIFGIPALILTLAIAS